MPDLPMLPVRVTVKAVVEETPSVRTFYFEPAIPSSPGQFVMVWVPGVDEVPMALSSATSITVQQVGDATTAMFLLRPGDSLGIRGPLGNGFTVSGKTLAIGGGVGAAPLLHLAVEGQVSTFLLGARTADELLFAPVINASSNLKIATDDGTAGHHGVVTDLMDEIDLEAYDHICVCGPEIMMLKVLERLQKAGVADRGQFSLHRYMKCGIGVCGSCATDPHGLRVCRDGPVFTGADLLESEFGRYARDATGSKVVFPWAKKAEE
ncbi:dihydroorotate dehydrogenase electron transfer subunit [Methanofollis aquaemaris]|uniref:Probable dihydroorotate dehydrogenase B (NAD(+)), electron transfer subunit n=1 Tax=Methanofollis aquaemaris TaxID=126734 RepID=A0A8A3S976_9EURY|nr:dihydroorotate dehydrogenase electron transfer subunit [Methanofollis aquaemaris]QSZ68056.1 dihydroorotate dehydrogenase electron transfer subunit [Methanofollis aquaemaris]